MTYPESTVEVIEIDPEVTRAAFKYLGLWPDTRTVTHNGDARMVVPTLQKGKYDLVLGDVFRDLSMPFHLSTKEFNEQIRGLLTDEGIYAVNVLDKLYSGTFLRAYVNTLEKTFPHVNILYEDDDWESDARSTYMVVGSFEPLSSAALEGGSNQARLRNLVARIMPESIYESWINSQSNILLTDDYAPVENLVVPLHVDRDKLDRTLKHLEKGQDLKAQGRLVEAIAEYDEAIRLDPELFLAYLNRGTAYEAQGRYDRAIQDYDKAISLNPEFSLTYHNRGRAYHRLGQYRRAIQDCRPSAIMGHI